MSQTSEDEEEKAESPDPMSPSGKGDRSRDHPFNFWNEPGPPDSEADETFVEADEHLKPSSEVQHFPSPSDDYDVQQDMKEKLHLQDDVKKAPLSFSPEMTGSTHRFRCPGPGVFQCTSTGLVFVMAKEAELRYRIIQWDVSLLHSAGKKAAGPLFNIECPEEAVRQLRFPHREPKEALFAYDLLSVAHTTGAEMSFLEPQEITDTHVAVDVPHLSAFGVVIGSSKPINGQVLLFLRPPNRKHQVLDIFLLQHSIPLSEVAAKQDDAKYIKISSDCRLYCDQSYSVLCKPDGFHIQPECAEFCLKDGPNFYPTFEVFLTSDPEEVTLTILDKDKKEIWKRVVYLSDLGRGTPQSTAPVQESIPVQETEPAQECLPAAEKLSKKKAELIQRVSEPNVKGLIDKLEAKGFISKHEKIHLKDLTGLDKARELIDMVEGKGDEAISALIHALRELDPCLSKTLDLL